MNWSVFGKAFLCETVYAIPFFILSILPFKKQLRFPIKILILFIFIGQLLQSSLYTYLISHGKPTRVTDTVFALVSLAIYFLCVKANFWKLLFLGDFILNYFVTVRGICFFLESRLFYDPSITYYSLRDESLLLISILLLGRLSSCGEGCIFTVKFQLTAPACPILCFAHALLGAVEQVDLV